MNKKLITIALVLVLAVSGVFAEYNVTVPALVTATLKATKGEFLEHGFTVGGVKYQSEVEVLDAFTTPPQFTYGYKTNAMGTFSFRMTVGNFIHQVSTNPEVKIASVTIGTTTGSPVIPDTGNPYYVIFSEANSSTLGSVSHVGETTITITPATGTGTDHLGDTIVAGEHTGDALAGAYTSTIEIAIAAS